MRIVKMVVTNENGYETTYEGLGHVSSPRSNTQKGKPYGQDVTAVIVLPTKDVKNS